MAERQFGPYRLVHQIATGGMAEIYLARTRGFGGFEKYVALKMIHPNFSADEHFIQMLVDEAKITVQLQHVNIAQVFDLGRVGETYYITMEYVDGCDLYKILRKASEQDRPMPIDVAVHVAREVANGLDYAHRKKDDLGKPLGIVHRDISPQNVLLSHAAEVKLVDFGIAKAAMRARQTAVGVIKGKYYYMSPEQAWGDPVDHRTDIFSAGILLYEMLTGQMLYLEEDLHRLLDMVRKADIPLPSTRRPDCPSELERIVMKALAKKPEQRFQSAHDFGAALERFLHARAPDFTTSRLSTFMARVLADEPSNIPPPQDTPEPPSAADPARVTRGLGSLDRDSLVASRAEISDENSVIFRPDDLRRQAQAAAAPARRMPDRDTPHIPVKDFPEEATLISGPPQGFGRNTDTDDLFMGAPPSLEDSSTLDMMMPALPEDAPTGTSRRVPVNEDGTTRIDIGVPGGTRSADDSTGETGPPPLQLRELATPTSARNPAPAVSALRKPRESRRTPHRGVPVTGGKPNASKVQVSPSLAPHARGAGVAAHAPTLPADIDLGGPGEIDEESPTISPHGRANGPGKPGPAPSKPVPAPSKPVQMAKPPGSFRPPGQPPAAGLPPAPAVMPPAPALKLPVRLDKDSDGETAAAPIEPAGLNWVFDPEPARAYERTHGQPPGGGAAPATPFTPAANPWPPPPPTALGPAPNGSPPAPAPSVQPGAEFNFSDEAVMSLAPSPAKRWRAALMALAFVVVAGAVAVVVAVIAARESPPPPPTQLEIISIPPGAKVSVDGKPVGVSPLNLDKVEAGRSYKLTVELDKYEKWERQEVVTERGRTVKVIAALKPIFGTMRVESTPPGAEVYFGPQSQPYGQTPLMKDNMDPFVDVDIEVRLKGYKPDRQRLEWGGARERTLSFKLVPSN